MSVHAVSEGDRERLNLPCPACGTDHMRRLARAGFWQRQVFSRIGYYPWECPLCRKTRLFRVRGKRAKAKVVNSEADLRTYKATD
jgi:predicted RNA-binding Zn-ribbon protein involved in translation (DUF1610 family)